MLQKHYLRYYNSTWRKVHVELFTCNMFSYSIKKITEDSFGRALFAYFTEQPSAGFQIQEKQTWPFSFSTQYLNRGPTYSNLSHPLHLVLPISVSLQLSINICHFATIQLFGNPYKTTYIICRHWGFVSCFSQLLWTKSYHFSFLESTWYSQFLLEHILLETVRKFNKETLIMIHSLTFLD